MTLAYLRTFLGMFFLLGKWIQFGFSVSFALCKFSLTVGMNLDFRVNVTNY